MMNEHGDIKERIKRTRASAISSSSDANIIDSLQHAHCMEYE
jgi:hypothetical protein